jgi:hypothetical protein
MPRPGITYIFNGYQRTAVPSDTVVTLDKKTNAVLLGAVTGNVYVTFDDTAASLTNGIPIVAGATPVLIPVGYIGAVNRKLHFFSTAGSIDLVQLS